jgi:hypothetical protein
MGFHWVQLSKDIRGEWNIFCLNKILFNIEQNIKIIQSAKCLVVWTNKKWILVSKETEMLVAQEIEDWYRISAPECDYRLIP